jgi:hypothetical protein
MADARRGLLLGAVTVLATVLATAACGGGGDPAAAPAGSATTGPAGPTDSTRPTGTSGAAATGGAGLPDPGSSTGGYAPSIDPAAFTAAVTNPYFPLRPGMRWVYRTSTPDGVETTTITVTGRTRTVMGVPCTEVRDTVRLGGEPVEDTLDWYAQHRDGSVWYFGEDTKEYENGRVTTTKGSWAAGTRGALPGVVMPAHPRVGDRYRQEYLRGEAEDMADVRSITATAAVPTGRYRDVVRTHDYTPLDLEALEDKYYARGVGVVLVVDLFSGNTREELVEFVP